MNEIRENLNKKMRDLGYWGDKMGVTYEKLDEWKKNGMAKEVAMYLLEDN